MTICNLKYTLLKSKKFPIDKIPLYAFEFVADAISTHLLQLLNESVSEGKSLSRLKTARVIPFFK